MLSQDKDALSLDFRGICIPLLLVCNFRCNLSNYTLASFSPRDARCQCARVKETLPQAHPGHQPVVEVRSTVPQARHEGRGERWQTPMTVTEARTQYIWLSPYVEAQIILLASPALSRPLLHRVLLFFIPPCPAQGIGYSTPTVLTRLDYVMFPGHSPQLSLSAVTISYPPHVLVHTLFRRPNSWEAARRNWKERKLVG
jgi:hypothetical protein